MAFAGDEEFFGSVSTAPSEGSSHATDTPQGKRRRELQTTGHRGQGGQGWRWQGGRGQDNSPLVPTLAKLAIKLDEEIRILKQNTAIVPWLKPGGRLSAATPVQRSSGVQDAAEGQSEVQLGPCSSPGGSGPSDVQGTRNTTGAMVKDSGLDEKCGDPGLEGSKWMEVSGVEPHASSSRGGQGEADGTGWADAASDSADCGVSQAAGNSSIPLYPQDDGGYGFTGRVPHEHIGTIGSRSKVVESTDGFTGQLCPAAARGGLQKGGSSAFPMGSSTTRAHPSLRLNMINTGNTCYMHATIQVLAWLADDYDAPMEVALTSRVASVLRQFYKKGEAPIRIMQDIGWRMLIQGWRHDGQQQDVGEFFTFVTSRHDLHMLQGEWQARTLPPRGAYTCMERGPCSQPILLHFCDPPPRLRADLRLSDMLRFWHLGQTKLVLGLHVEPHHPFCSFNFVDFEYKME